MRENPWSLHRLNEKAKINGAGTYWEPAFSGKLEYASFEMARLAAQREMKETPGSPFFVVINFDTGEQTPILVRAAEFLAEPIRCIAGG